MMLEVMILSEETPALRHMEIFNAKMCREVK